MESVTYENFLPMAMKNNQHNLFTASGCLSTDAFERLAKGSLDAEEQRLATAHIMSCELCALAYEGLTEVDPATVNHDLDEVKRKLQIIGPLDFMPEKKGLRMKLKVKLISFGILITIAAAFVLIVEWPSSNNVEPSIQPENAIPFRLEVKDTAEARLVNKYSDKKARWEQKIKKQKRAKELQKNKKTDSLPL